MPGYLFCVRFLNLTAFQPCPPVYNADVQFCSEFYRLSRFASDDRANERLTDADDALRNTVGGVVVHVLLLLIDFAQRVETLSLSLRKLFSI